jgi:hypothetical protein
MIGRANRYHHWHDIQRFKSEGISTYDSAAGIRDKTIWSG